MKVEDCKQISRGYLEVNMDALNTNVSNMKNNIPEKTKLVLVIKTDAYGHGAIPIAQQFETHDEVWGYAVATAEEALALRKNGISKPILILGFTFDYCYEDLIKNGIRPAVFKEDMLVKLNELAGKLGAKFPVHVKVDTGMSRIGIKPNDEGLELVRKLIKMDNLVLEGIFTHMAKADELDKAPALNQKRVFKEFVDRIENELNIKIPFVHCNNSAGIIELKDDFSDLMRAGITLYGLWPSDEVVKDIVELVPVASFKSHIAYIKEIEAGTEVSYGGTYVADSKRTIATIPVGYGDGYPRGLSGKGYVLIRGQKAYICGRVCMDQFMVDVTDISGVSEGDLVTLIGRDGNEEISMEYLGDISGRFNYELACDIGKRIPRVYVKNGEVMDIILDRDTIK